MQKVDGKQKGQVIAKSSNEYPEGQEQWVLRALGDRIIELEIADQESDETIRTVLKKNPLKLSQEKNWHVGPTEDANYVAYMEDVLGLYTDPDKPRLPIVCVAEGSTQLANKTSYQLKTKFRKDKQIDYKFGEEDFSSIFIAYEPLTGKTITMVNELHTEKDFAHFMKYLIDEVYSDAEKIVLVTDGLDARDIGPISAVFPTREAIRLWRRLAIHSTPRYGSWLNMAEIELSVLGYQVLNGRLKDLPGLPERVMAWQSQRDAHPVIIDWRSTCEEARIKFKRLYPVIEASVPAEKRVEEGLGALREP